MNRFRTKKRAKDDLAAGRSSEDSEHSSLSFFRKGKKVQQEEVKKEFDLSNALPSNDDFRTSLLMNNLSARFSMLREQDNPNTKIGKASDDSVLFPKRQSRLADFGFGAGASGLSDIAEVESIRGPTFLRTQSVASDDPDAANGGGVLSRARPTEGNNLFGGRQKIYKIPANSGAGLSGRALYEDDVALSAFQRWRQSEREKALEGLNGSASSEAEDDAGQDSSESPNPIGYNRKRETSSTTSSSAAGRNSTAATSVTSQGAAAKDGQSTSGASAVSSLPERSVTRTRRLYEQGFNQDGEPQGLVSSRIESLTRPRPFGTKTSDPSMRSTAAKADGGFQSVLAKASASSFRSLSPPAAGRTVGALGSAVKAPADSKPSTLGGLPPLSPPVSDIGEQAVLPILPQDVGKATAMGIFDKPLTPYDESQYVQRQLQLQQGRETPTQRHRAESDEMPAQNAQQDGTREAAVSVTPAAQDARLPSTPAADTEAPPPAAGNAAGLGPPREVNIERPADEDHPAFRQSAMPTPLSVDSKSQQSAKPDNPAASPQQPSPVDSPTLGPNSGLSGLVRQHLRTESVDSSLGGPPPDVLGSGPRFNAESQPRSSMGDSGSALSPWPSSDQDWIRSDPGNGHAAGPTSRDAEVPKLDVLEFKPSDRTSTATEDEPDEFASQLANARRRVREKLTSYVESDSSRAPSPLLMPTEPQGLSAQPPNPLGILKPKSSRGSLIDRSRNMVTGQSKGLKILGLGAATMSSSPQPTKQSFEEKDFQSLETMEEEVARGAGQEGSNMRDADVPDESKKSYDEGSNTHPGLKAFRQARRELQKRKELETLARHQMAQTSQPHDEAMESRNGMRSVTRADRGPRQRTPSSERRPPPVSYRHGYPGDEQGYASPGSVRPSGERSRSGSEASGGRSSSRPPRLRTNTNNGAHDPLGPPNPGRPVMRSPALPGTDVKGSPLMPSYPHPYVNRGAPSPAPSPHLEQSRSAANLALQTGRPGLDALTGQPSPISPMGLPSPAPYATGAAASPVGTPTSLGGRPRLASTSQSPALGPANSAVPGPMRRPVDKRDISESTFMTSTSRVPTTTLPHHPPQYPPSPNGQRSRSSSRAASTAPPVPPINPRRRREDSRAQQQPQYGEGEMGAPRPPFAGQANSGPSPNGGAANNDENGGRPDQWRLRKAHPDMQGLGSRGAPNGMI